MSVLGRLALRLALLLLLLTLTLPSEAWAGGGGGQGVALGLVGSVGLTVVMASVIAVIFHRLKLPPLLAYTVGGLLLQRVASHLLEGSMHT